MPYARAMETAGSARLWHAQPKDDGRGAPLGERRLLSWGPSRVSETKFATDAPRK